MKVQRNQFQRNQSALLAASVIAAGAGFVSPVMAAQQLSLEEIIVTARRVEENIQDVPISISAYDQTKLDKNNVLSGNELSLISPSLNTNQRFGTDNSKFAIRGVVQEDRTAASVAVYFADVVSARGSQGGTTAGDGAGPGAFFDLQNVQVLKGPQGTLFGRNTTGGAVLLVPNKPTEETEGYVEGSLGDYEMRRVQGVFNAPISDSVRFRAGIDTQQRDGYIDNISPIGPDNFADVDYLAGRVSLVIDIADNIENYSIFSFANSEHNGLAHRIEHAYPTNNGRATQFGQMAQDTLNRLASTDVWTVESFFPNPKSELETWQLINTTTWEFSDSLTAKNIISYAELSSELYQDPFTGMWPIGSTYNGVAVPADLQGKLIGFATLQANGTIADQYTFTEEFRLEGVAVDERMNWQAGIYFENSDALSPSGTAGNSGGLACDSVSDLTCVDVLGALSPHPQLGNLEGRVGSLQWQDSESETTNLGIYAQTSFDITDKLGLTAGVRYTKDKTESDIHLGIIRFPDANDPALYCLSPGGPFGPGGTFNNAIARGKTAVLAALAGNYCTDNIEQKSDEPTWTLGLDYQLFDSTMVYGNYSRGYRQGSTNPFGALGLQTFEPEEVDVYELGSKTSWAGDAPGFVNLAVFYNDFSAVQVTAAALDLSFAISPNTFITTGESEATGFELETGITLFDRLSLTASYAYVDSELESLTMPPLPPGSLFNFFAPVSTVGESMVLSPQNRYTLSATYALPVDESLGAMEIGAIYSYTDDQWASYQNQHLQAGYVPDYGVVNINLNWNSVVGSNVDLSVFGSNVLDEEYRIVANERVSSGFDSYTYGPPAMWGLRAKYNF